jgi:lipoprotein-anchoring transpeptidase ErfK/SrfK
VSTSSSPPKKNRPRTREGKARPRGRQGSIWFPIAALLVGSGGAYVVLTSCGKGGDPPQPKTVTSAVAPGATNAPLGASSGNGLIDPSDGGDNNLVAIPGDAYIDDRDTGSGTAASDGPMLGAAHFQTHVFEKPDYSSARIGYLRAGAKVGIVGAIPGEAVKRIKSPSCKEGWIAIQPRGYVCLDKGGGALNLEQPNVKLATAPPNFDDLLPYKYGFVWRNGAPLYRKVPTPKEWKEKEPWLAPKPKPKPKAEELASDDTQSAMSEADFLDGGVPAKPESTLPDLLDAGAPANVDAGAWWERDAGKGEISLKDTMEAEGLVARRMAKGFAIAIDRTFMWSGRAWHRTTMGLVAPADSVTIVKAPEFKGVELGTDMQLPLAWSLIKEAGIFESKDKKLFAIKDRFKRQTAVRLMSPSTPGYEEVTTGGITYVPTFDGRWVRAKDVVRIDVSPPPADLKENEKWVDVSIKSQALVLYEGTKPVFATLISSGKDGTNVKGQFATVQGSFRIREKHVAATMDGDTSGELYSIDDVPYIQYFHTSYALHGAFWHSDYGRVRSHGCVNLSPSDAKRIFQWTEPQLPTGWHAVWASDANPGTRVITRP